MKNTDILYEFQHIMLPYYLNTNGPVTVHDFCTYKDEFYFKLLEYLYSRYNLDCPYTKDDCHVGILSLEPDLLVVELIGLDESAETLCHTSFIFYNVKTKELRYFCTEVGFSLLDGHKIYYLCEWDKSGKHINYENISCNDIYKLFLYEIRKYYTIFMNLNVDIPLNIYANEDTKEISYTCKKCGNIHKININKDSTKNIVICQKCFNIDIIDNE